MALPRDPNFKVYDPHRGEEWNQRLVDGGVLSMRHYGFLVIDYWPGRRKRLFEIEDFEDLIATALPATGELGFMSVAPLTPELRQRDVMGTMEWKESCSSAIGYFPLNNESLSRHVGALRLATYEDFVIGSCHAKFGDIPKRGKLRPVIDWNIEFLFTQVSNIGTATLYSSETGIIRIYTRIYPGLDEQLRTLGTRRRD